MEIFWWGFGGFGQLGTGTVGHSLVPLRVADDVRVARIGG
ncbi:MAG: hypothetical protein IH968_12900 [Gemmatimonadetes bacterium]|nr:hypothetical protein [Gemmatimonadota bacterium]